MKELKSLVVTKINTFIQKINARGIEYVVVKHETPSYSEEFPKIIFEGTDIDIFVIENDYKRIVDIAKELQLSTHMYLETNEYNSKIRFEEKNKLVLQIDISLYNPNLPSAYIKKVISRRVLHKNGFFILNKKDELIFRLEAIYNAPKKRHHYLYILKNYFKLFKSQNLNLIEPTFLSFIQPIKTPFIGWILALWRVPKVRTLLLKLVKRKNRIGEIYPDKIISQEVPLIFCNQFHNKEFNRFDIIVRLLAIEQTFNLNSFGWELYNKMQDIRSEGLNSGADIRFKKLISSIETNGFNPYSAIPISTNGDILDGAHRFACALHFNLKKVGVDVLLKKKYNNKKLPKYDINWFKQNEFTKDELKILKNRFESLITDQLQAYFQVIIWSPAMAFFNDIKKRLREDYILIDYEILDLKKDYNSFVHDIYKCDDIADWKIEKKITAMSNFSTKVGIIRIILDKPKFRRKANNNLISIEVEKIKKKYRDLYKNKIKDYTYDIIMHIGDNFDQVSYMEYKIDEFRKLEDAQ